VSAIVSTVTQGIFITITSHPFASFEAVIRSQIASLRLIINLVILPSVSVIVFAFLICSINRGTTLQFVPSTFHHRTHIKSVFFEVAFAAMMSFSATALQVPYILKGSTALSVETSITRLTQFVIAASITFCVPVIFVSTDS
jgi:hypothetical protein